MPHDPTRRDFLKATALAGTAAAIGVDPPRTEPPNPRTRAHLGRSPDALGAAHPRRE